MRAPVMKAMGFVMANGTFLLAAHAVSLGLGGNRAVRSSAEDRGVLQLVHAVEALAAIRGS